MKNVKDCLKFRNGGITLIALVITIIVLLILAGVTIAALSGDNGIITQGKSSVEENFKSEVKEELNLLITSTIIENYENNTPIVLSKKKISDLLTNFQICSIDNALENETESNDENILENGSKIYLSRKNSSQNDMIAVATFSINDDSIYIKDISLSNESLPFLVDEVDIGSYVDYPVEYTNTIQMDNSFLVGNYNNEINGWRVLAKNGSGENGTVTLISAGIPLRFYHSATDGSQVIPILNNLYKTLPRKRIFFRLFFNFKFRG